MKKKIMFVFLFYFFCYFDRSALLKAIYKKNSQFSHSALEFNHIFISLVNKRITHNHIFLHLYSRNVEYTKLRVFLCPELSSHRFDC